MTVKVPNTACAATVNVTISNVAPVPPANNAFAAATTLTGNSGNVTGSNDAATKETGEPLHAAKNGGASVWWKWTAPSGGTLNLTTAGSTFDTLLGVYTGTAVNGLTQVASNDNSTGVTSAVNVVPVTAGTTYRIAVDGLQNATNLEIVSGAVQLGWTFTPTGTTPSTFTVGPVPSVAGSPPMTATGYTPVGGDFNGDGRHDVLWYGAGAVTEVLWVGGVDARYTGLATRQQAAKTPVPGDFNGDGIDDVFWYAPGFTAEELWLGTATGAFATATARSVSGTYTPVPGDFNGDGHTDIYWYTPGAAGDNLWLGNPGASFVATTTARSQPGTFTPIVGEFDGDGTKDDIFWYGPGATAEQLWLGDAAATFTIATARAAGGSFIPTAGDYDGDGIGDIFFYAPGSTADTLWLGRPGGAFVVGTGRAVNSTFTPVSGDINGDAHDDIYWYQVGAAADALFLGAS